MPRFMTFDEWKERNADLLESLDEHEAGECEECGGSGRCKCDCGDEHDCGYCYGTGRADPDEPDEILYSAYEAQRKEDERLLSRWQAGNG